MIRVLAINGSYRVNGITDQTVHALTEAMKAAGAEVEIVLLREYPLEFCLNCRACTQQPGASPGDCLHHDGMQALIEKIDAADSFILAAPTNFGSVTALYKRFMERLAVYAYWPWEKNGPEFRKARAPTKKALLVSSSAAPGILGRWFFGTEKQLKMTARTIGARVVGSLFTGMIAREPQPQLPASTRRTKPTSTAQTGTPTSRVSSSIASSSPMCSSISGSRRTSSLRCKNRYKADTFRPPAKNKRTREQMTEAQQFRRAWEGCFVAMSHP